MALRTLSLCAGVGGIDLGLKLATDARTVCYVEWSRFPAAVIAARIKDGCLDDAPVWDDVGTFDGRPWRGAVDLVAAGFPCQPVSLAGKRRGMADERFIWDDIARIIGEIQPAYAFLENVPGILTADGGAFLDRVLSSLVALGFDCEWDLFSAEETGAPHKRQRWFCLGRNHNLLEKELPRPELAHTRRRSIDKEQSIVVRGGGRSPVAGEVSPELADPRHGLVPVAGRRPQGRDGAGPTGAVLGDAESGTRLWEAPGYGGHAAQPDQEPVADTKRISGESRTGTDEIGRRPDNTEQVRLGSVYPPARNDHAGWAAVEASLEPAVCRDADGLDTGLDTSLFAYRNQRLRAVGNGVVPLTAATAWIELRRRIGA